MRADLGKTALIAAVFVPVMGAHSVYYSLGMFHQPAVLTGIAMFILQWWLIFRSPGFRRRWQRTTFKVAFIANSVLRLPVSMFDPWLFLFLLAMLDESGIWDAQPYVDNPELAGFWATLALTLLHGVAVQLVYGLCLLALYGLIRLFTPDNAPRDA